MGAWLHHGLGLSFAKVAQALARLGIDTTAGAPRRPVSGSVRRDGLRVPQPNRLDAASHIFGRPVSTRLPVVMGRRACH